MGVDIVVKEQSLFSATPLDWENMDEKGILKRVAKKMSARNLWIAEEVELEFRGNELALSMSGKCQYNSLEIFLLLLAQKGYEGKIETTYTDGRFFSRKTLLLKEGKLLCIYDDDSKVPDEQKELLIDNLLPDYLHFLF